MDLLTPYAHNWWWYYSVTLVTELRWLVIAHGAAVAGVVVATALLMSVALAKSRPAILATDDHRPTSPSSPITATQHAGRRS